MVTKNAKIRSFIIQAFLRINQNESEVLSMFQDQLFALGNLIKQRDEELFDEIIRTWTSEWSTQKIKVELNRAKRIRN